MHSPSDLIFSRPLRRTGSGLPAALIASSAAFALFAMFWKCVCTNMSFCSAMRACGSCTMDAGSVILLGAAPAAGGAGAAGAGAGGGGTPLREGAKPRSRALPFADVESREVTSAAGMSSVGETDVCSLRASSKLPSPGAGRRSVEKWMECSLSAAATEEMSHGCDEEKPARGTGSKESESGAARCRMRRAATLGGGGSIGE